MSEWVDTVERLSTYTTTSSIIYAAFTHGLMSKWTYLTRTTPNIGNLFSPLKEVIRRKFLTSLTCQNAFNDVTRELLALPVRLGGLGISNPSADTTAHHDTSKKITAPLTALMEQSHQYPNTTKAEQLLIKQVAAKAKRHHQSQVAAELKDKLPTNMHRAISLSIHICSIFLPLQ